MKNIDKMTDDFLKNKGFDKEGNPIEESMVKENEEKAEETVENLTKKISELNSEDLNNFRNALLNNNMESEEKLNEEQKNLLLELRKKGLDKILKIEDLTF